MRQHWHLYCFEAAELALFMLSACVFTVLLFYPQSAALRYLPDANLRRSLLGVAMGATAVLIINSPMGKRSGAHFNPAITITYFRLGKILREDALFYILAQFCGGIGGVGLARLLVGPSLAAPSVEYAVTVPGIFGVQGAFFAEFGMAFLLMSVVLWFSNRPSLARKTSYAVGVLIALYVFLFAPVSGFSINPARTVGSAVFAHIWTAVWIYFAAPIAGMMASAECYVRIVHEKRVLCAKLNPDPAYACPFLCSFPLHRAAFSAERLRP